MIEKIFAALVLAACLVAMLRMVLPAAQRSRLDAAASRTWARCRRVVQRPPVRQPTAEDAARLAQETIRRAREGHWEGNVYKPRSFRRPKKPH